MTKTNLVLVLSSLLLAALLAELGLRLTGAGHVYPFVQVDDRLFVRRPFWRYVNRKEHLNLVEYNNLGFHDHERARSATGRYRILFLGDSFVEGAQVPVEELFTSQLEKRFQGSGLAVEVINGGVVGVGTAYEYLLWKHYLRRRLKVDHLVLFMYLGNDLENNNKLLTRKVLMNPPSNLSIHLGAAGEPYLDRGPQTTLQVLLETLRGRSALINTMVARLYLLKLSFRSSPVGVSAVRAASEPQARIQAAWREANEETLKLIRQWHSELRQDGLRFSIILLPSLDPINGNYKKPFVSGLKDFCRNQQIGLLDLSFPQHDLHQVFSFDGQTLGHFNQEGHRMAAEKIYPWLRSLIGAEARGDRAA
jgi:lysophospholipase L1-like esterase